MKHTQTVSNKTFSITMDKQAILSELNRKRSEYERTNGDDCDQEYIKAYTMPDGSNFMNQTEYEQAYDDMIAFVEKLTEDDLHDLLGSWPRKKNGTLHRRRVKELYSCDASRYICEWHNTWIFTQLRAKAVDDTHVEITLYEMVDTPA